MSDYCEYSPEFLTMIRDGQFPGFKIVTVDAKHHYVAKDGTRTKRFDEVLLEMDGETPVRAFHLRGHQPYSQLPGGIIAVEMPLVVS